MCLRNQPVGFPTMGRKGLLVAFHTVPICATDLALRMLICDATLYLGSLEFGSTRDEVDHGLLSVFRPSDRLSRRLDRRKPRQLAKYVEEDFFGEYDETSPLTTTEYRCLASAARDRLDLKGYTADVAEAAFIRGLEADVLRYERHLRGNEFRSLSGYFEDALRVVRSLNVSRWKDALIRIREEGLSRDKLDRLPIADTQLPLLRYMLDRGRGARNFYGFPEVDRRHALRIALETAPPREVLTYDLTCLKTEYDEEEDRQFVSWIEDLMNESFSFSERVIVLTEGDTDRRFLKRSLDLLRPHLSEFFHFFDFKRRRVGGGAGELANLIRAFAAADVRHRLLALFDNDTGARAAISNLDSDSLPDNIAVRHYPSLAIASNYPTIGPSGAATMDVNGLAGGIELYLGQDVLRGDDGAFSPVQWKGYDRKIGAYQGEILNKKTVLNRFDARLSRCEAQPDQIDRYDWQGIEAIIDTMCTAFHEIDKRVILRDASPEISHLT